MEGKKNDVGKRRYSLLPREAHNAVVDVLEFGAKKYAPGNWRNVPELHDRYYDAALRHIDAYRGGETIDPESELPHLAHALCCLYFILGHDIEHGN